MKYLICASVLLCCCSCSKRHIVLEPGKVVDLAGDQYLRVRVPLDNGEKIVGDVLFRDGHTVVFGHVK